MLEMSYRNFEGGLPRGKRSEHLARVTWHGSPDARVNLVLSSDYDCLSEVSRLWMESINP